MTATLGSRAVPGSPDHGAGHREVATAVLRRGRDTVTPALQAAVDRLDDASRTQARYHLGWTELDGSPGAGGGKAVRPALALLSAAAAGAGVEVGVPGAVAVELVHNFSLLHDDLMDGDTERRHRTTVWVQWGASSAILCGDAMLALAQEVLLEAPSPHAAPAARLLAVTTRELIRGQAEDLAFESRDDVGVDECLSMAAGKTGSLLAASASIGAVLAGAPAAQTEALHTYGHEVGMAFQLVDDLLGIWGDPGVTGKPVLSDLRSRKKSLPVTYAIRNGGDIGRELGDWLAADGDPTDDELHAAARLVEQGGGREWAAAEARRRRDRALDAVTGAGLLPGPTAELVAVAHHLVDREF
ncbi:MULTISPECIES: polyprenyl synthetase family protein [Pseudonocardia]|jgi:geranylgeranyl diphosphate synthase type I|uniref:polyprenyl synthetase family protein n=1 Tax=Pseudonocardia TaxID=1847 RepID=UPI000CD0A7E1|nr:polyprenyl synthetase family protein [Pseudonocardia dioxanivorans]GJF06391.1 (2E,6E)-farnesyl diphosphate synthase [Pseudonocardia sp. D17]